MLTRRRAHAHAQVMDVATSKTGKHGHAKCNFVGIDIFTGKKYEVGDAFSWSPGRSVRGALHGGHHEPHRQGLFTKLGSFKHRTQLPRPSDVCPAPVCRMRCFSPVGDVAIFPQLGCECRSWPLSAAMMHGARLSTSSTAQHIREMTCMR